MTTTAHTLSEQVYLAFHDWRARLDTDLDRLSDDYLLSLHTDIQRTLTQIGYEIDARRASHSLDPENIGIAANQSLLGVHGARIPSKNAIQQGSNVGGM